MTEYWVVHDLTSLYPAAKGIGPDEPSFGPMSKQEALDMVARNPKAYYARRITSTKE